MSSNYTILQHIAYILGETVDGHLETATLFFREKKIRHMTRAESWQQFMAVNHGYCLPKLSQDRGFIFQRTQKMKGADDGAGIFHITSR